LTFRELMHPTQSNMELDVLCDLNHKHLFPSTTASFPVISVKPDFYFPDQQKAVFLDGQYVHRNRVDRDEYLRELLEKRHGIKSLSITYDRNTKRVRREIVQKILAFLGIACEASRRRAKKET